LLIPVVYSTASTTNLGSGINWFEANFLIGIVSSLVVCIAIYLVLKLTISYFQLRKLHKNLTFEPLTNTEYLTGLKDGSVSVAFHSLPLVPFTFGWKNRSIVLPKQIKDDSEKLDMAIQHELVHIRRGDYLLQLAISLIQSLFWFHPLIRIGAKEIETYREISCDQEVLNTSDIHPKKYANLLLELIPLNKEYGSFTVSMAVKQSTLKQRIETMKHHKMHKASYKRSLLILVSITLMVIAPIACSDLRGPETLSEEEILKEKISIENFVVEINGKEVMNLSDQKMKVGTNGTGAIGISPKDYGFFKIAISSFDGSKLAGSISGNKITFRINEMDVSVLSSNKILLNSDQAEIWVRHYPDYQPSAVAIAIGNSNTPPPPSPPTNQIPYDKEVFVVVENMPEIQGGMAAVQSKVEYPPVAIKAGTEGRVTVQFIVDEEGNVVNPKVIRGIGGGCDEEALRVVSQIEFTPGVQRGRNVAVQMSLPILFKLTDSEYRQSSTNDPPPPPIKSKN
tara:strand:+ start:37 stop:1563 length:1527 start_codon:yes stop_codon:yes gene_type:complete